MRMRIFNKSDMDSIKKYLKSIGITQIYLAEALNISRPTLDLYIELYEKQKNIPKERYNIIFQKLFDEKIDDKDEFLRRLDISRTLLNRDERLSTSGLDALAADYISDIHDMLIETAKTDWDEQVYKFILLLLGSYKKNAILYYIMAYFVDLNLDTDPDGYDEDKKLYYSNLFNLFNEMKNHRIEFNEEKYGEFLKRKFEISQKKKCKNEETLNKLKDILELKIKDLDSKGIELSADKIIEYLINGKG